MARGVGPRQPAKSGKQAGVRPGRSSRCADASRARAAESQLRSPLKKNSAKKPLRRESGWSSQGIQPIAPDRVKRSSTP